MSTVTVYSTGDMCVQCRATCRRLETAGITFEIIDIAEPGNSAAREWVTEDLGYSQAPVVIVDGEPEHHWSGFRPDLIDQHAAVLGRA